MRVNRQTLLKIAEDTVAQRVRANRNLFGVYLTGSVGREADPVFGGAADIDLVFLHEYDPPMDREIIRLTEDIHLDILHHTRREYSQVREFRVHPEMGPVIYGCQILHDPRHFLDFSQASVRAHFYRADNVLQRARAKLESARQIWFSFQFFDAHPGLKDVRRYLKAIADAAGSIVSIGGGLLSERRFLSEYFEFANGIEKQGLYSGLLGLLGGGAIEVVDIQKWLPEWKKAYSAIGEQENCPSRLHPYRFNYYNKAFVALLESDRPMDVLWPLINTWLDMLNILSETHVLWEPLERTLSQLGLMKDGFKERIQALDIYLDLLDETLENWAADQGI